MRIAPMTLLLALFLVACADAGDPAETVEKYIQAKVEGDAIQIRALLCSEMESVLERESRTFESVSGVSIEGMDCQQEGESSVVRCQGKIIALYGTEETEFPLVSYRVVEEDGEWRWCGEAP
ncbi:MAG: hypothetical protein AMJ56_17715 [Anaerolineae bacterium SG8_19]|jgi:hypothetical protein|nr:MAG: hypothetical protein AMJ56_17715 [Anaerolineae bacterium SG8_19]